MAKFGKQYLKLWKLDESVAYLNHGTVGCCPADVLAAQNRCRDEMERSPSKLILRDISALRQFGPEPSLMRQAAAQVATFIGNARPDDTAWVDNATTGCCAVLRSLAPQLTRNDVILVLDEGYGAVTYAAQTIGGERGATVVSLPVPNLPNEFNPDLLVQQFEQAIVKADGQKRVRLAIFDHITSSSALVLPVHELADVCRRHGVLSLIDGAHAPGQLPDLNVPAIGADFYTGNLHKWALAPRSCAFLWARREHHGWLHPVVLSWYGVMDSGFPWEFDWVGTKDPSSWLTAPTALQFFDGQLHGQRAVYQYTHGLVVDAARMLARRWPGTLFPASANPDEWIGSMVTVSLPDDLAAAGFPPTDEGAARLRHQLLVHDHIEIQLHQAFHRLWIRISCHVYNDASQIEQLYQAIQKYRCKSKL